MQLGLVVPLVHLAKEPGHYLIPAAAAGGLFVEASHQAHQDAPGFLFTQVGGDQAERLVLIPPNRQPQAPAPLFYPFQGLGVSLRLSDVAYEKGEGPVREVQTLKQPEDGPDVANHQFVGRQG